MFASEENHWWYVGMRQITRKILDSVLVGRAKIQILDAGCGTGKNLEELSRYGEVTGIDYSGEAIDFVRRRGANRVLRASVDALPFADASFDLVTSFDVLSHRAVPEPEKALNEIRRVLRPSGAVLLRLPAFEWLRGRHDLAVHNARRFTAPQLSAALEKAGFNIRTLSYANTALLPVAVARRVVDRWVEARGDDLTLPPPLLNALLGAVLGAEARFVASGSLPVGVTIVALGVLPGPDLLEPGLGRIGAR